VKYLQKHSYSTQIRLKKWNACKSTVIFYFISPSSEESYKFLHDCSYLMITSSLTSKLLHICSSFVERCKFDDTRIWLINERKIFFVPVALWGENEYDEIIFFYLGMEG